MVNAKAPRLAVKAVKAKSKVAKAGSLTKELMGKAVRHIATEIVAAKPGLDSRTPRGFADSLLKEAQETFPKLTMNKINYAVKLLKMELKNGSLSLNAETNVSSLTDDCEKSVVSDTSSSSNRTSSSEISSDSEPGNSKRKRSTSSSIIASERSKGSADVTKTKHVTAVVDYGSGKKQPQKKIADIITESTASNTIGRPKGSTDAATRELCESIEDATKEAVQQFKELKSKGRSNKKRLKKGSLKEIIAAAKQKFFIPDNIIISTDVVRQRLKRGRNHGHAGHKSPMEAVEPYQVTTMQMILLFFLS
jgi:hypothetical protein